MSERDPHAIPGRFEAAINAGDLDAALALWGERSVILTPQGERVDGREAISAVLGALIASGTRVTIDLRGVYEAGDVALAQGQVTMRASDGTTTRSDACAVYARNGDGGWQLALDAPWGLPAAPQTPSAGSGGDSPSQ